VIRSVTSRILFLVTISYWKGINIGLTCTHLIRCWVYNKYIWYLLIITQI